ncbi:uncharacterized protein LOC130999386 [Salvia miltiorrhiza]|uniref:uncharacterized protein LOC130999386 n=1 Tax=Salvia miltiorrhiza TaxID=226208 RepID=UPI0025ABCE25|nr:uncharacterized protein LOC130999386 [Salvia miltiorrhiza]XP_057780903.1 uncharacterized protein LOC130999386 [Salvia miltiorrhiza]XP_057780904.1 uncharacterized protein LOC130999386 [Salvia miltiorrhiza]
MLTGGEKYQIKGCAGEDGFSQVFKDYVNNNPNDVIALKWHIPPDLVRRRMQLEGAGGRARVYRKGLVWTLRHIFMKEGWLALYWGILPEYYKVGPDAGIIFVPSLYDLL